MTFSSDDAQQRLLPRRPQQLRGGAADAVLRRAADPVTNPGEGRGHALRGGRVGVAAEVQQLQRQVRVLGIGVREERRVARPVPAKRHLLLHGRRVAGRRDHQRHGLVEDQAVRQELDAPGRLGAEGMGGDDHGRHHDRLRREQRVARNGELERRAVRGPGCEDTTGQRNVLRDPRIDVRRVRHGHRVGSRRQAPEVRRGRSASRARRAPAVPGLSGPSAPARTGSLRGAPPTRADEHQRARDTNESPGHGRGWKRSGTRH